MRYGYIRVSTREQDETRQIEAMKNYNIDKFIVEKASGKNFVDREEWQKLMAKVVVNDIIVVKSLDRLGRNSTEIKETFELLLKKQVYIEFIEDSILNTNQHQDKIMLEIVQPIVLHLLSKMAEKERNLILERQREAYNVLEKDTKGRMLSNKKRDKFGNKKVIGRPNLIENLTKKQNNAIKKWVNGEKSFKECKEETKLGKTTLYKIKKEMNIAKK